MNSLVPTSVCEPLKLGDFSTTVDIHTINATEPLNTAEDDVR